MSKIAAITTLSEFVGYKAGLALGREKLQEYLGNELDLFTGEDQQLVRIRFEEFEECLSNVLYAVGNRVPELNPEQYAVVPSLKERRNFAPNLFGSVGPASRVSRAGQSRCESKRHS